MEFQELLKMRESCREYTSQSVEHDKLLRCLEAARLAPSACNSQPWHFYVTQGELKAKIAPCVQGMGMNGFASDCDALVVVTQEKPNLSSRIGALLRNGQFAPMDVGMAVMQFCLAAADEGLGTCILGWLAEKKIRALIDTAEGTPVLVIAVGYPARQAPRPKSRKKLEEMSSFLTQGKEEG